MSESTDPGIKDFINRELLPRLEAMQQRHRSRSRLFMTSALVSTDIVIAGLGLAGVAAGLDELTVVEFGVAMAVIVLFGASLHALFHVVFVRGARDRYVDEIAAPLIDFVRPGVEYRADESISRSEFEASALAQLPIHRYECRDVFAADLDGQPLRFSEVEVRCRVRKEDEKFAGRRDCFVVRGLLFIAPLSVSVEGTTVIAPTLRRFANADELPRIKAPKSLQNPVVRPGEDWPHVDWIPENHPEPMGEVTLPDPEFQAQFDVWSTDIAESRSLLSSPFCQRLKEVYEVWRAGAHRTPVTQASGQGHFTLVLRGDRLYLNRPMPRKLIEMRSFAPGDQVELLVQFARDVRLGIELADRFHPAKDSTQ